MSTESQQCVQIRYSLERRSLRSAVKHLPDGKQLDEALEVPRERIEKS